MPRIRRLLIVSLLIWPNWWALPLRAADVETLRVVMLGDSITKGVRPGVTESQTFSALVEQQLTAQALSVQVFNVGIGGERTDGALARLERDVLAKQPHFVTVMYGTNDSYVDAGKTDSRLSVATFDANLRQLVKRLQDKQVSVILMTEPRWSTKSRANGVGESPNVRLEKYMATTRAVAKELDLPLVDHFGHWSLMESKHKLDLHTWTTDGCHPNPRGHAELAHRMTQTLLPLAQRLADKIGAWNATAEYRVQLDTVTRGYDGEMCWVHPRAAALPTNPPTALFTMQKLLLTGSDVFYALNDTRSDDFGQTWSPLREHTTTLGRRNEPDDVVVATCDFWPKWHAKSGKVLGIGQTVRYLNNKVMERRRRETSFSVYDAVAKTWSPWTPLVMPNEPKFESAGAGSAQCVDLANGDILLPIYFRSMDEKFYRVTVVRCSFDGQSLKYVEHGTELELASGRGVFEPSLIQCGERFFLTLRNDTAGYVSVSDDGKNFSPHKAWTWDDGSELGNYNTQQHWVTHRGNLYLVYTRRGANNDHVFRNRAPLFMARVDQQKLHVIRSTERIIVPEYGARLGNFGITEFGENETWVTVAEWMQTWSPNQIIRPDNIYGADNRVFAARIRWNDR